jgi:holliday junction DNA helicase RuvA
MIAHLTGVLREKTMEIIVLDVNGVGYEVFVPLTTLSQLPVEGERISLFIHTVVREDAITLFGFGTARERAAFRLLISVSGVGPKLGMAILSIAADDLVRAISAGDLTRLTSIPGIGRKTAERLVLELKDKIGKTFTVPASSAEAPGEGEDDLVSALVNLGYKEPAAKAAAKRVSREHAGAPFAQKIREALKLVRG